MRFVYIYIATHIASHLLVDIIQNLFETNCSRLNSITKCQVANEHTHTNTHSRHVAAYLWRNKLVYINYFVIIIMKIQI